MASSGHPLGSPLSKKASATHSTYSHAVSRSQELLSCAKTALKIAKSQNASAPADDNAWSSHVEPSSLHLHDSDSTEPIYPQLTMLLEDGVTLLRAMQASLRVLDGLVKRRGHTNDPTQEIAIHTRQLEADAKELAQIVQQLQTTAANSRSKQFQKHLEWIATWLQTVATQQTTQLKEILKVRGTVLADQAQRRKMWNPQQQANSSTGNSNGATKKNTTRRMPDSSPLFTMTPASAAARTRNNTTRPPGQQQGINNGHVATAAPGYGSPKATSNGQAAADTPNGGAYGGGYGGYGSGGTGAGAGSGYGGYYGSGAATSNSTGMRQRRQGPASSTVMVQEQVHLRQQERQTKHRLASAQQAESSLAELSTMFSKMSNLIVTQGETLEKLEDDVEAAQGNVEAGHGEIQTLYAMKKGNRGLIIKLFGVLIFVIIFMRFY